MKGRPVSAVVVFVFWGAAAILLGHQDDEEEGPHGAHPTPEPQHASCTDMSITVLEDAAESIVLDDLEHPGVWKTKLSRVGFLTMGDFYIGIFADTP